MSESNEFKGFKQTLNGLDFNTTNVINNINKQGNNLGDDVSNHKSNKITNYNSVHGIKIGTGKGDIPEISSDLTASSVLYTDINSKIKSNTNFTYNEATNKTQLTDELLTSLTGNNVITNTSVVTTLQNIDNLNTITKDPTGFEDPSAVIINYDSTTQKITLTGTFQAYWRGKLVSVLTTGYVSPAHTNTTGNTYWLYYNGSSVLWDTNTFPGMDYLLIAFVNYGASDKYAVREPHGISMSWKTHQEFHEAIGTYKYTGGTISSYVLSSTTAANRRPDISLTIIKDEDVPTSNAALTTKLYTQMYLAGASGAITYVVDSADIVPLSTNQPYYNQYTGGAWQQTLMSSNTVASVWIYAIPTASDTTSQKYRYVFLQPQWTTAGTTAASVLSELARNTSELNLGTLSTASPEFVAIARIVISYTGTNWQLENVSVLTGNKYSQISSPSGSFLSSVTVGSGLSGSGTTASPLTNNLTTGLAGGQTIIGGTAASETLTISTTNNATKGKLLIGTSAYDEVNNRLGIGTNAPNNKLQITETSAGAATWPILLYNNDYTANSEVGIKLAPSNAVTRYAAISAWQITTASNNIGLKFYTGTGATITSKMVIDNVGSVGIGTSSPFVRHHTHSGQYTDTTNIPTGFVSLVRNGDNASGANGLVVVAEWNASTSKLLELGRHNAGDNSYNSRFIVTTNGLVMIGTTSGLSTLSINGGLHVGGDSDAGDNNCIIDGTLNVVGKRTYGTNVVKFVKGVTSVSDNTATEIFTITTTNESGSNDGGTYTVIIKAHIGHPGLSTSTAANQWSKTWIGTFSRSMEATGTGQNSPVETIFQSCSSIADTTAYTGWYRLVNKKSGLALAVANEATTDAAEIRQIRQDYYSTSMLWKFVDVTGGYYKIEGKASGKVLDVTGAGTSDGTLVELYTYSGGDNQKWQPTHIADGYYKLIDKNSSKALEVRDWSTAPENTVNIWSYGAAQANQLWRLMPEVANINVSIVETSEYVQSVKFKVETIDTLSVTTGNIYVEVELIYSGFTTPPTLA